MTPLTKQLEDKEKELEDYRNGTRDWSNYKLPNNFDRISLAVWQIQAEIAILEQAITEINDLCNKLFEKDLLLQKQRQEILEGFVEKLIKKRVFKRCKKIDKEDDNIIISVKELRKMKERLNQPKEEGRK